MRQMNAGPSRCVPSVVNPAAFSASYPVVGVASQPRSMSPGGKPRKSTMTRTPTEDVHELVGSAAAATDPTVLLMTPAITGVISSASAVLRKLTGR
jgi:hypothetical protein